MFKNLWRIAEGYRKPYGLGLLFTTISAFFAGAPFAVLYLVLVEFFEKGIGADVGKILLYIGLIFGCFILQFVFGWLGTLGTMPVSQEMTGHWQVKLGEHLRHLSMGFFNQKQAGDINTLVSSDAQMVSIIFFIMVPNILTNVVIALTVAVASFFMDWRMALALVVGLPFAGLVLWVSEKSIKRLGFRRQVALVETNARLIEYTQGISVLKAFKQTGANYGKLDGAMRHFRDANLATAVPLGIALVAFSVTLEIGAVFVLLAGSYFFFGGAITVQTFLIFLILSLRFYTPLQTAGAFLSEVRTLVAMLQRLLNLVDTPPLPEPAQSRQLDRFDIEFENVSFKYEETAVLQNISFRTPERSITALVGPSGSGKSTVTNLVARFWDANEGKVKIGGIDVRDLKTEYLLTQVSMVFQNVYLFNDSIENNIKFGKPSATEDEVIAAAKAARCHDFITALPQGYRTLVSEGGASLSGGEKQRISIARAILKDAPIILLDEATASVDPENESLIQQAINTLVERKTLLIIAHRLSTIQHADQILVLENGRLVERGKHAQLVAAGGLYSRFWQERQKARSWKVGRTGPRVKLQTNLKPGSVTIRATTD